MRLPSWPWHDVRFVDVSSGEHWEAQLKATDDVAYVQAWIDEHPEGEILVTQELAGDMELPSSGLSNEELTVRADDVVDRPLQAADEDSIWDYFPALTAVSVGLVVWEAWQRYRRQEISLARFRWLAAKTTGLKTGKIALLSLAMLVPGINVVTGAALVANMIVSGANLAKLAAKQQQKGEAGLGKG